MYRLFSDYFGSDYTEIKYIIKSLNIGNLILKRTQKYSIHIKLKNSNIHNFITLKHLLMIIIQNSN